MIHLKRLPEPEILTRKKQEWLANFINSGKTRPDGAKYAHPTVVGQLNSISHNKCYYCERPLKGNSKEIDHYIEVACDRSKAYDWDNLFLACENCNNKIAHGVIPVTEALNPFINTDAEIEAHISFEHEIIRINNSSDLGGNTIRKFRLDSERLDYLRSKFLNTFWEELADINDLCRREQRDFNDKEKESLRRYSYPDYPFSMMFRILLGKRGLL